MKHALWLIIGFLLINLLNVTSISATAGISYDLTSTISSIVGSSPFSILVADHVNHVVYFGTIDGKLGYYNETSNTSVDLTPLISWWVGANYIYSGTVDTEHHRFYFTAGQIQNLWGFVTISDYSATQLPPYWWYMTSLKYDQESKVIWFATNNNEFGYINTSTNSINVITTSGFGDICIDYQDDRVYVVVNNGVSPPYYYDKNTTSIVSLTSIPFYTLMSCDIDPTNRIIYMGRGENFQSAGYYLPDIDTWVTSYWNGDSVYDVVTRYLPRSNLVVVMQSGIYGSIYNITDNSTINLLTTEQGTWMDLGYSGMAGDYMNTTQRMYMGFSDGAFGYYDDSLTGGCVENWLVYNGSCQTNDTYVKYYLDNNSCGFYYYLPPDNGTIVPCNYCTEDIVKSYTSYCYLFNGSGLRSYVWLDNNYYSCCAITGIISDCSILYSPYNESAFEGCTILSSDFELELDHNLYFGFGNDKVFGKAWLNSSANISCISYVKTNESEIIQTNPTYSRKTDSAILPRDYEDREFFHAENGLLNVYWTKDNLVIDGREYIFGVQCADGTSRLTSEHTATVEYESVNSPTTRFIWFNKNMYPIILGGLILIILIIVALAIIAIARGK
jgi:hypothetical protein